MDNQRYGSISISVADTRENREYYATEQLLTVCYYRGELPDTGGYQPHVIYHSFLEQHSLAGLLHIAELLHGKGRQLIRHNADDTLEVIHPAGSPPPAHPVRLLN